MSTYISKLGALAAVLLCIGIAGVVFAQDAPTTTPLTTPETITTSSDDRPAPMVIDIDDGGEALIRGVVARAGSDSITVASWGGDWVVRVNADGAVVPEGVDGATDLSSISVGDFVGVEGAVSADETSTIDARLVRNWTTDPYVTPLPIVVPDTITEPVDTGGTDSTN